MIDSAAVLPTLPETERPARPARVLIVDESKASDDTGDLTRLLQSWGHDVRVARTWDDGLRQATSAAPDVMVVNRGKRSSGSLKPVRLIRLLPGLRRTPILVVWNRLLYLLGNQLGLGEAAADSDATPDLHPVEAERLRETVAAPAA